MKPKRLRHLFLMLVFLMSLLTIIGTGGGGDDDDDNGNSNTPSESLDYLDFWPITVGNTWTYRDFNNDEQTLNSLRIKMIIRAGCMVKA